MTLPAESHAAPKDAKSRARILCVDDEPNVLEGLGLHLRRRFDVLTATSGAAALTALENDPAVAVIISDMRMPGMDGATFLSKARQLRPDATRLLLTGQSDLDAAIHAINEGQLFRFLMKPCPPPLLLSTVDAAVEQHRLVGAERVLLEQTLAGSVKMLADVLAIANPLAFGRATRIQQLAAKVSDALGYKRKWQVEMAAVLSQLGFITLPPETVEKAYYGGALTDLEGKQIEQVPFVASELLRNIPRVEGVRTILTVHRRPFRRDASSDPARTEIERGGQILRVALDYDELERTHDARLALDTMLGRSDTYDPAVIEALADVVRPGLAETDDVRELPLGLLRPGMRLVEDLKSSAGALLVARGQEITGSFLQRMKNFKPGYVKEPVRVVVPRKRPR